MQVPIWLVLSKPFLGSHFGLFGEFTTHVRTDSSGDWDVHWGHDLNLTHGHICMAICFFWGADYP